MNSPQHVTPITTSHEQLEQLLHTRQEVLQKVRQIDTLLQEVQGALARFSMRSHLELTLTGTRGAFRSQGLDDAELAHRIHLDRDIWMSLHTHLLSQVQTGRQRRAYQNKLYEGNYQPVTRESLLETLKFYHDEAPAAFVQSVYDLWRALEPTMASNAGASFGKTQILAYCCEYLPYHKAMSIRGRGVDCLRDLSHIITMYQNQGHDTLKLHGVPDSFYDARYPVGTWVDFGAFKVKLFKKGTMHLVLTSELREIMNKTLATAAGKKLHADRL